MKKSDFLKKYIGPIVLVVGFLLLLLTISLFKAASHGEDKGEARNAGQNSALNFQRETLTELSYLGGQSMQMSPELALQYLGQGLQELIEENKNFASQYGAYSNSSKDEILATAQYQQNTGQGIFSALSEADAKGLRKDPQEFIASGVRESEMMRTAAQELLTMYDNRVDRLTENLGMSANEVFDLARETKVNLFAHPENFLQIMVDLGLDWTESDRQAPGVNLDSKYLEELSRDSSGYFDALIDSLGSFFNACKQC